MLFVLIFFYYFFFTRFVWFGLLISDSTKIKGPRQICLIAYNLWSDHKKGQPADNHRNRNQFQGSKVSIQLLDTKNVNP